jgi:hypothetical protein
MLDEKLLTLEDLKPAPYNPRDITAENAARLAYSMSEFGDISGITFNTKTGHLVTGHQRLEQLRTHFPGALRFEKVAGDKYEIVTPLGARFGVRVVEWNDAFEKAANVAANAPALQGLFQQDALETLLAEIRQNDDLLFDNLGLHTLSTSSEDGSAPPESVLSALSFAVLADPVNTVQKGDVLPLGPHFLVCADIADGWPLYMPLLQPGSKLLALPGPYVLASTMAQQTPCVLVQPDPYIAALIADKWALMETERRPITDDKNE